MGVQLLSGMAVVREMAYGSASAIHAGGCRSRHQQIYLPLPALGESRLRGSLSLTRDFTSGEIYLLALHGRMKGHSQRKTSYLPNSSDCSMQSESLPFDTSPRQQRAKVRTNRLTQVVSVAGGLRS